MNPPAFSPKTVSVILLLGLVAGASSFAAPEMKTPPVDRTVLRIARSKDGLSFKDDKTDFLIRATSPTMTQLKNGSLVVMVDYGQGNKDGATELSVTRSGDGGKSWSPLRPVKLDAPDPIRLTARHGSFARTPDGRLNIFFTSTPVKTKKSSPIMIFSAATHNGLDYRVDRSMRLGLPNSLEAHPMVVSRKGRLHLLIERVAKGKGKKINEPVLEHFVSPDGTDFARLGPRRFDKTRFVGDVIALADGYRAYVTTSAGIRSFVSKDLRGWKPEEGLRMARGWDPAVIKLNDNTYVMVYCTRASNNTKSQSSIIDTSDYGGDFDSAVWIAEAEGGNDNFDAVASAEDSTKQADWVIDPKHKDDWWNSWDPEETDGFAPPPDFQTKIDYYSWYSDYLLPDPQDNAYDAYAEFMPGLYPGPDGPPEWPEIKDMFSDDDFDGPPGPWKPEDHPEWAESNDKLQDILAQFHDASKKTDYAIPPHTDLEFNEEKTDDQRLLMGLLLPNLSDHRKISRAALADAWRVDEDGKVSPGRMKKSIETALRAANHLDQGQTLIEELVAASERSRVHETALLALEHDVFSGDEIESVLKKLKELDQAALDPAKGARGEHGFAMDITQYIFSPPTDDGSPQFNGKRAQAIVGFDGKNPGNFVDDLSKMTPDDVVDSIEAFNRHYTELTSQIRVGYPDVRGEDIEALEEENLHTSPLTTRMMPRLSQYYRRKARAEASRRATQLTYAVHLYKKQNGRWPASLDELPINHSTGARTDPFTGNDFKYEMTDSGPRIYSLSENATDDGGRHSPRWDDRAGENGGSDDYVFWPPQPNR